MSNKERLIGTEEEQLRVTEDGHLLLPPVITSNGFMPPLPVTDEKRLEFDRVAEMLRRIEDRVATMADCPDKAPLEKVHREKRRDLIYKLVEHGLSTHEWTSRDGRRWRFEVDASRSPWKFLPIREVHD